MRILGIREHPELLESGARYFNMAFGGQNSYDLYFDCIRASLTTDSPLPRWFLAMDGKKIAGGCGLVTNDFISRMDLWPWLSALYVGTEYRGQSLGSRLLAHASDQAGELGFSRLYLSTTLDGYYEKYGWERIEDGFSVLDGPARIYTRPTAQYSAGQTHAAAPGIMRESRPLHDHPASSALPPSGEKFVKISSLRHPHPENPQVFRGRRAFFVPSNA